MHNPESLLKNQTHKLLRDFQRQTDHIISARRPYLVIINIKKRTCRTEDFAVTSDHSEKLKEREKKDQYLDLAWELKQLLDMKVMVIPIIIGDLRTVSIGFIQGLEDLEIRG